ncbi:putative membrane protein [Escherichia coli MP021017.5]|nr:putative membrane protein [Escherichia coli TX1999]EMU75706.1 putative membrane protein [Escherichia coli MP021017.9]EMU80375.1 putative membrane protein [Escherichia coli MP021017.5]EMU92168.1 putative membrane protein [Escherichia coli MP021017.3]
MCLLLNYFLVKYFSPLCYFLLFKIYLSDLLLNDCNFT